MANLCDVRSGVRLKPSALSLWKLQVRFCWGALALGLCCLTASLCVAQDHDVLCSDGSGSFQAEFNTGVTVQVRAARTGELATLTCEATLGWKKNSLIIATNASQLDVDTFGVDLGLGVPVATFQVKKSSNGCFMQFQVYSLEKPPRLLRTVTGGDFFSAADTDLDGRVEIWTNDAAAVEGFENLGPAELDAAPTIVLRFVHGELLDASSEFQPHFDREIAGLRKELDSDGIRESASEKLEVTPPAPIMLRRPPLVGTPNKDLPQSELLLELVIDSAGKVRSAEPAGKAKSVDAVLIHAVNGWKFIPAFKAGRAIASRMRLAVSLRQ